MRTLVDQIMQLYAENWSKAHPSRWNPFLWWIEAAKEYSVVPAASSYVGEPKNCYVNAATNSIVHDFVYVDGYVFVHGVPLRHAWNLDANGQAIEVTIRDLTNCNGFFGVEFPSEVASRLAQKYWSPRSRYSSFCESLIGTLPYVDDRTFRYVQKKLGIKCHL